MALTAHLFTGSRWKSASLLDDLINRSDYEFLPVILDQISQHVGLPIHNTFLQKQTVGNVEIHYINSERQRSYTVYIVMLVFVDTQRVQFMSVGFKTPQRFPGKTLGCVFKSDILKMISDLIANHLQELPISDQLKEILVEQQKNNEFNLLTFTDDV